MTTLDWTHTCTQGSPPLSTGVLAHVEEQRGPPGMPTQGFVGPSHPAVSHLWYWPGSRRPQTHTPPPHSGFQVQPFLPAWSWGPWPSGVLTPRAGPADLASLPETWDFFFWLKKIKSALQLFKTKTKTLEQIYTSLGIPSNGPKTTDSLHPLLPNFPSLSLKLRHVDF